VSHHRADKRASQRRTVDTSSTFREKQLVELPTPVSGGKRKAVKPSRAGRATVSTPRVGRAGTHGGSRKTLIPGIPSTPTLIGAAALLLAATGAVTVSSPDGSSRLASGNIQKLSGQASVLSGDSSIGSSSDLSGRERAVSRDSQREAMQDAADEELQAAAEQQAKERNAALAALAASAEKQATLIAKNAWQIPVAPGVYHLTSRFGQCSSLWSHCHTGLDFAAPSGTPIRAIAGGVVTEVGYSGAYGNRTIITLEDGTELWYCHQTAYSVSTGQEVRAGEVIGSVGSTGNTTGPHLHLEVRPGAGDPVDPDAALVAHGVTP
jgi:murein DD-endopeptidase MepM/ murein hydrolase activator NlpD